MYEFATRCSPKLLVVLWGAQGACHGGCFAFAHGSLTRLGVPEPELFHHPVKSQKVVKLPEGRCEVESSKKQQVGGHNQCLVQILTLFVKRANGGSNGEKLLALCCPSGAIPKATLGVDNDEHWSNGVVSLVWGALPCSKLSGQPRPAKGTSHSAQSRPCLAGGCQCQQVEGLESFPRQSCRTFPQHH